MSERKSKPEPKEQLTRRAALGALALGALSPLACRSGKATQGEREAPMTDDPAAPKERMPVVFVGHGSPMNVIQDNAWSRGFARMGQLVPRPKAILAISAHWFVDGTWLTADPRPKTIHDFSGFPRELYEIHYRAPGSADIARRVRTLLGESRAGLSTDWGLDHGTWSVLRWMYPAADIPVLQLSIDRRLDGPRHLELARSLRDLREEGVLILGSGNVVHNLRDAFGRMRGASNETPDWAARFDQDVKLALEQHDTQRLGTLWSSEEGRKAHPSPDHFWPLLYVAAAATRDDRVQFPVQGFDMGSISMRNVILG